MMKTNPATAPVSAAAIDEIAANWLSRRERGLSVDEQAEFSRWLLADARHADSIRELEANWRQLQRPRFTGQAEVVEELVREKLRRKRAFWRVAVASGAVAAAAAVAFFFMPSGVTPNAATGTAAFVVKPERRTLPDGSVVEMNANSEIELAFTPEVRGVKLLRGEALFEVTKNPARPFVVSAGSVAVRAVGTAFTVRLDASEVGVLVTEGKVAVERSEVARSRETPVAPIATLTAGRFISVPHDDGANPPSPRPLSAAEQAAALAWRGLRVELNAMRLGDAVDLFNRSNRLQLSLGDADLADVRLSGVFWSDDPEGFTRLVEGIVPLRSERRGETIVLRHP